MSSQRFIMLTMVIFILGALPLLIAQPTALASAGLSHGFSAPLEHAPLLAMISVVGIVAALLPRDGLLLLPIAFTLCAMLPRADVRDAWVSPHYASLEAVPQGAVIGTSSARRAAQLLHLRPDIQVTGFRGNVETRLRKLDEGVAVATFLASAGLLRLGLEAHIRAMIAPEVMLPAVAQGAIGIECRADDTHILPLMDAINHTPTMTCVTAERAYLQVLDGSCRTPIAGLATLHGDALRLRGEVLSLDGRICHRDEIDGPADEAETLGQTLGQRLRERAGEALLQHG